MTTPHYRNDQVTVYHGDCLNVLPELPDNSVDSVVTDPPYGLEFMGKDWDRFGRDTGNGYRETPRMTDDHMGKGFKQLPNHFEAGRPFQRWCQLWAIECLRILKPGGHLLAFGGTRTHHRLTCAIEDAGFEIRDSIAWLYGSGFPKSLDVSKAIDKQAGAEREIVGCVRNRIASTHTMFGDDNWKGIGEKSYDLTAPATDAAKQWQGWGTALKPAHEPIIVARKPIQGTVAQNVQQHGTGALNIDGCRIGTDDDTSRKPSLVADTSAPFGRGAAMDGNGHTAGRWPTNVVIDQHTAQGIDQQSGVIKSTAAQVSRPMQRQDNTVYGKGLGSIGPENTYDDSGGASRFFPTFKYEPKAPTTERPNHDGTAHPTVKPLDLMRWLIRLVTPPHGTVLDPFAGSGTTAEAAIHEHMHAITIEQEADYLPVIVKRLHKPMQIGFDFYDIGELDT